MELNNEQFPRIISSQEYYIENVNKALEKVKKIALQCIVPIIDCNDEYNLHVIGSAVLLNYNSRIFLVTASHVIPDDNNKTYFLPCEKSRMPLGGHTMRMKSNDGDDKHDLLLIALYEDIVNGLSNFTAIKVQDVDIQKTYGFNENVALFGYPTSRNRKNRKSIQNFYIQGLMERTAPDAAYQNEKYSTDINILVNFERDNCLTSDLKGTTHPDPHGMSGGGVWRLFGPNDRYCPSEPYLIGIILEKSKYEKYVVAVKLGYVINALNKLEEHIKKKT
jgi:hypothetical protein